MQERFPHNDIINLLDKNPTYNLGESTSKDYILGDLLNDEQVAQLKDLKIGYGTSQGYLPLRQRIANNLGVSEEDVLITNGSELSIFLSIFCLAGAGDEIVTVLPNFPLIPNIIAAVGAKTKAIHLQFSNNYEYSVEDFDGVLSEKTKAVIIVSPHNPSGVTIEAEKMNKILALMDRKCPEAFIIMDETYRQAAYGDMPAESSLASVSHRVISVGSLSKCHGVPGIRIGWLSCQDQQLLKQLILAKMNTIISCSVVDERIALMVLECEERILKSRGAMLQAGLKIVEEWVNLNSSYVDWVRPHGGAMCCIKLKESVFGENDVEQFYYLLSAAGLQVGNGAWFGEENRIFRLGFGFLPMEILTKGLDQLTKVLVQASLAK
ncbi:MAG TPA: pyridoxal phosphate-dependent aminotransferase [Cyclobacteriaceae bacterium]|nr:pyridoxal phosphate-dependent aminotransferase [Cyclobacteriaceae bacterium]